MSLAYEDLDYVDVSIGILQNIDGDTLAAEVVFEPQFDMAVHTASKNVIYGTQISKKLTNGSITQRLLASDTRGLNLTNFDWKVTVRALGLTGIAQEKATFERRLRLLRAAPEIDLDILQPVPQPSRPDLVLPVVTSIAGLTGEVTAAQLTAAGVGGSSGSTDPEVVRDVMGTALTQGQHVSITVDDSGNTITIGINAATLAASSSFIGAFLQRWRPATAYTAGVPIINAAGQIVTAKVDFTSGATYDAANWNVVSGSVDTSALLTKAEAAVAYRQVLTNAGGGDQTARINAALSAASSFGARKTVVLVGDFTISAPLVVPSRTTLDAQDATVTLADGSNCNMVQNTAAQTVNRSAADAAITSGTSVLTSTLLAFTSADVGRSVLVAGAGGGSGPLCGVIASVVDSRTVNLAALDGTPLLAGTTVSAASAKVYVRDIDVAVVGGIWNRGANLGAGTGLHTMLLRRVDRVRVENLRVLSTDGKYAVNFGDCTKVRAQNIDFNTASDGVHVNGPALNVVIRNLTGFTGDDSAAITARDYTAYNDVQGDIAGVVIDGVQTVLDDSALCKIIGGTGVKLVNIVCRNLVGTAARGVAVIDDLVGPTDVRGLIVDGVSVTLLSTQPAVELTASAGRDVQVRGVAFIATGASCIGVLAGSWESLSVDGIVTSKTATNTDLLRVNGTIPSLRLTDAIATFTDTTTSNVFATASGASIGRLVMSNVDVVGGRCVWQVGHPVTSIVAANINAKGINRLANISAAADLTVNNLTADTLTNAAFYVSGSGSLTLRGSGVRRATAWAGLQRQATQAVQVVHGDFPVDVSMLTKALGDRAYNTNATLSCGAGPVISDGTSWKHTFTGATY